ncbi:MAG TPA: Gfo/Idh/MocA family oxidoreductase [Lentisphaeria bacterium]|nr:MAG: Inositol 2-dehydrogenase [Lentisphaerae bacterium ADurb.Bin082]HQC53605.1 Gfo/Idh/MocA family oxidoreductase [Lentisphaeria bacterium]
MGRLHYGILGAGNIFFGWGNGSGHLPGCPWVIEEGRLAAICDINRDNLNKAASATRRLYLDKAAQHRAAGREDLAQLLENDCNSLKLYSSLEEMLQSEKLDFTVIITPCEHHAEAIRKILAAGCHILCEKPLVRTWLEAQALADCVSNSDCIFLYGENLIYADPFHDVRKLIAKGEIGELDTVRIPFSISKPGNDNYANGRVGALLDNGIHAITLAWHIIGFDYVPQTVKALHPDGIATRIGKRLIDGEAQEFTVEDYANFAVLFVHPQTGHWVSAILEASWSFGDMTAFKATGNKGEISIKDGKIMVEDAYGNSHPRNISHGGFLNSEPPPGYGGHPQQLLNMIRLVRKNAVPLCDIRKAAESLAIAQSAYLSEARGKTAVTLDEFKQYAGKFSHTDELLEELLSKGINKGGLRA